MKNTVVHFGCGALGRGLVLPLLYDSGKELVVVDTNDVILNKIRNEHGYDLLISDAQEQDGNKHIEIKEALSSIHDRNRVREVLKECDCITTSVKRENLKYLVEDIVESWGDVDTSQKMIICCENVEKVGDYFKNLLLEKADDLQKDNIKNIRIPDTIVDRICSMDSSNMSIVSEQFHELSVDSQTVSDTHIKYITSVNNIEGHFYRKRYLLNSYADAISFLALKEGYSYLYEAASSEKINQMVKPYMDLLKDLLNQQYGIASEELEHWQTIYQTRLSNPKIPRELNTVARNLWGKLTLEERFVKPLVQWKNMGNSCETGLKFIKKLLVINMKSEFPNLSRGDVLKKLQNLWGANEEGIMLYKEMKSIWRENND